MSELIIESVPSGAEVQIDGEIVGTTPMTCQIDEGIGLAEFRDECLSGGNVVCSWDVLKTRLEDKIVSRLWWFLTEPERRSIAEKAIKNTLYKTVWYCRMGEDGEWEMFSAPCGYNTIIRSQKFGTPVGWYDCYWKYSSASEVFRYVTEQYYGLPTVHVNIVTHAMCGIQVVDSIDNLNNWIVFQYSSFDIKPGHSQMPHGKRVIIQDPFPYTKESCASFDSTVITEFQI